MSLSSVLFALQTIGGIVGLPLVLLTCLISKHVRRHTLFLNFLSLFIVYTISLNLLLFTGNLPSVDHPDVPIGLCLFQTATVNAMSAVVPLSVLFLIINVWMTTCSVDEDIKKDHPLCTFALASVCWIAFLSLTVFLCIAGSHELQELAINNAGMACTLNSPLIFFIPFFAGFFTIGTIIFEGLILFEVLRKRDSISAIKSKVENTAATIACTGIFSVYAALSLIAAIGFGINTSSEYPHVIQSSLPFAAFLVFVARKDILTAWGILPIWNKLLGIKEQPAVKRPIEPAPPGWSHSLYPMSLDKSGFRLSTSSGSSNEMPSQHLQLLQLYGPNNV